MWPTVELWLRFHSFRVQSVPDPGNKGPKPMIECGVATITSRKRSKFIRVAGLDSCKKWLRNFLYVKNKAGLESDFIKLPTYREGPPIDRHNWDYSPGDVNPETKKICEDMQTMLDAGIPTPDDLVLTFISRRDLPLQQRRHKICQMSGHLDPTRIMTRELSRASIRQKVKDISASQITDDLEWGLPPYSRKDPAPINLENAKIRILPDRTYMDIEDPDSVSNTYRRRKRKIPPPADMLQATTLRTKLYQDLLWEHRSMSNAHKSLQLQYEKARVEAKNPPALKELEIKLNAAQEEKTEMSNMLGKLKESNIERDLELQQQKDEVSRLKAELEALKEAKAKEIAYISSSCTKEIEEVRKFYEDRCAKEEKFEAWKKLADMLNHNMEDLLCAVTDAFPESQYLAVNAVLESRKDRSANKEPYWSMEDHMVAMAARVTDMKVLGIDLPLSAIKVFKAVWPGAAVPKSMQGLCKWLNATELHLSQWRESVGRAGADMALQFILSWYEEIDFESISTLRVGSHIFEDPAIKLKRQAKAYELASYAPVHDFIPDPEDEEGAEGEEEGSEGSTEDIDEEVDEELEAEAPPSKKTKTIKSTSEEPASSSNVGSADIPSADAPSIEVPASSEKK
ncbi:hypothetical protein ACQ4PT_026751 [Festuca glaucescens]